MIPVWDRSATGPISQKAFCLVHTNVLMLYFYFKILLLCLLSRVISAAVCNSYLNFNYSAFSYQLNVVPTIFVSIVFVLASNSCFGNTFQSWYGIVIELINTSPSSRVFDVSSFMHCLFHIHDHIVCAGCIHFPAQLCFQVA